MGNEQSQMPGIEIEEKNKEVSDYWSHHSATICSSENVTNLSVFIEDRIIRNQFWVTETPLQKSIKNLMVYRHPCILKYVSSWQKNLKSYLAVEDVTPLAHIVTKLSSLQISIGLYSILKSLRFLHEKALASHNNVCISSIYVTKEGNWKLGGMEFLCKYNELTSEYLSKSRGNRYNRAVDSNEDKLVKNGKKKDFVDIYAFSVLAMEVLKSKVDDELPALSEFLKYCQNEMQDVDVAKRPNFKDILEHDFFNQEFIKIHSFLVELPLKLDAEKTEFFKTLGNTLKTFDEVLVASQLSGLLLSRMVLLNNTAQRDLLPLLLSPRQSVGSETSNSLFSAENFKFYLCPKLIEIFKVRDVQIRLLLLDHFHNFMHIFSKDELQLYILPELLVGIKDTNDHLVSVTLRTLADLVSILGSATVIGGKRAKLFNDGRPKNSARRSISKPRESFTTHHATNRIIHTNQNNFEGLNGTTTHQLPERPRPDGEEEETSTEELEPSVDEDLENWDDWEVNENQITDNVQTVTNTAIEASNTKTEDTQIELLNGTVVDDDKPKKLLPSIQQLDIKSQLNVDNTGDEFDFFQDMEPVIHNSNKFFIEADSIEGTEEKISSKLAVSIDQSTEDGWDNNGWE